MSESIGDLTMASDPMFVTTAARASCYRMCCKFICENVRKITHLCRGLYLVAREQWEVEVYHGHPVKDQMVDQTSHPTQHPHPACLASQILEPFLKVVIFLSLRTTPSLEWVVTTKDISVA